MLPSIAPSRLDAIRSAGPAAFFDTIVEATLATIHGTLDATTMATLTPQQITLLAYHYLREEVLEGGFIQLIHNGFGPFIFLNPFAKAMRLWGKDIEPDTPDNILHRFSRLVYDGRSLFERHGEALTRDMDDDAFMALYEQFPEFDDLDDTFVDDEEAITAAITRYIQAHLSDFVNIA